MNGKPLALFAGLAIVAAIFFIKSPGPHTPPPIFTNLSMPAALEAVKGTPKILVVKATATWCGPCRTMDETTWRDDAVVSWFNSRGVVIALDVDQSRPEAENLRVNAIPTMIAFDGGGKEIGRITGGLDAAQLLGWLNGLHGT